MTNETIGLLVAGAGVVALLFWDKIAAFLASKTPSPVAPPLAPPLAPPTVPQVAPVAPVAPQSVSPTPAPAKALTRMDAMAHADALMAWFESDANDAGKDAVREAIVQIYGKKGCAL